MLTARDSAGVFRVAPNDLIYERYPDPVQEELKTHVAAYRGVRWQNVFVGVGSDEAIDMLVRIFCVRE
jgi:histidinol-phosphate aminotransferase